MKLALTSDLHGYLPDIQPCDILLIAGDICPDLRPIDRQADWLDSTFRGWLEEIPADMVVATWGNHDFIGQRGFYPTLPWTILEDEITNIGGVSIYGSPWTPEFCNWAFMKPDEALARVWAEIPSNLDILMVHGPPYGCCDMTVGGERCGSKSLVKRLNELEDTGEAPKLLVCGHIHEGRGSKKVGSSWIYNVAFVDERYQPRPEGGVYIEWEEFTK